MKKFVFNHKYIIQSITYKPSSKFLKRKISTVNFVDKIMFFGQLILTVWKNVQYIVFQYPYRRRLSKFHTMHILEQETIKYMTDS